MTSGSPTTIGPFKIERELGRGGMGEVFLARDTRLDRQVALKSLPAHMAQDPERLARFQREAKVLASLNYPGIGAIYGIEEAAGQQYLVLEFVAGESLAERLARGPIPVDETLALAKQIAEALEVAHDKGVVHRDVKPGNVMVTPDGAVKVLDFGLARTADGSPSSISAMLADGPTLTSLGRNSPTIPGAILGTAGYMSPEQARGKAVDKRSDIFSFGCVLYEMLTGSDPFPGETVTDSLGAILHREPNWSLLPPDVPSRVRDLLTVCLAKDRKNRLHDIGDARIEIENALKRLEAGEHDEIGPAQSGRRAWVWPVLAACFALAALAGFGLWVTKPTAPNDAALDVDAPDPRRSPPTVLAVEQVTDSREKMWYAAISPDASTVAYSADVGDTGTQIHTLRIGGATPFVVNRSERIFKHHLAFSPGGESIAYLSWGNEPTTRGIFVMGATGESPRRILEPPGHNPAWSPDGRSLAYSTGFWVSPYSRSDTSELWIIDIATRERRKVDTTDPGKSADTSGMWSDAVSPDWSPDGTRIAYWGVRGGTRDIFTVSPTGGDVIRITDDVHTDWNPIWSPDGRSIWFLSDRGNQPGIWWIALDEEGKPAGPPRPIVLGPGRIDQFSRSRDGRSIVALVSGGRELVERVRFDPKTERFIGSTELLLESTTAMSAPDISRDGEWIAFHSAAPQEDITVIRLDGSGRRRLTEGAAKDRVPRWSPDGKELYYYSNENGDYQPWVVDRDSAEARPLTIEGGLPAFAVSVSPDSTKILFLDRNVGSHQVAKLGDDGTVTEIRPTPTDFSAGAGDGRWSSDNRWVSGNMEYPDGLSKCVLLDSESNSVVAVQKPDGELVGPFNTLTWIDATRLLFRSTGDEQVFVFDVSSGESRWVEDVPADLGEFITLRTDGWLYTKRSDESSNLWLITLEVPDYE